MKQNENTQKVPGLVDRLAVEEKHVPTHWEQAWKKNSNYFAKLQIDAYWKNTKILTLLGSTEKTL